MKILLKLICLFVRIIHMFAWNVANEMHGHTFASFSEHFSISFLKFSTKKKHDLKINRFNLFDIFVVFNFQSIQTDFSIFFYIEWKIMIKFIYDRIINNIVKTEHI